MWYINKLRTKDAEVVQGQGHSIEGIMDSGECHTTRHLQYRRRREREYIDRIEREVKSGRGEIIESDDR